MWIWSFCASETKKAQSDKNQSFKTMHAQGKKENNVNCIEFFCIASDLEEKLKNWASVENVLLRTILGNTLEKSSRINRDAILFMQKHERESMGVIEKKTCTRTHMPIIIKILFRCIELREDENSHK